MEVAGEETDPRGQMGVEADPGPQSAPPITTPQPSLALWPGLSCCVNWMGGVS